MESNLHSVIESRFGPVQLLKGRVDKPKIFASNNGQIIKCFHHRKLISSSRLKPYAKRFQQNAQELTRRGIKTVTVRDIWHHAPSDVHLLAYDCLVGEDLRDILTANKQISMSNGIAAESVNNNSVIKSSDENYPQYCNRDTKNNTEREVLQKTLLSRVATFLAQLHQKGIFFRSIHLGNIVLTPENNFALIDIADVRFRNHPLGYWHCQRNLLHLLKNSSDQCYYQCYGFMDFIDEYLSHCPLSSWQQVCLKRHIMMLLHRRTRQGC